MLHGRSTPEAAPRQESSQARGSAAGEDTPREGAHAPAGDTTASFQPESVAFSPDGRRGVSGGWDVDSGQKSRILKEHEGGVKSVTFTLDGKQILSGSEDRTLARWNAGSGKLVRRWWAHRGCADGVFRLWRLP